jgi:hypothetical protein
MSFKVICTYDEKQINSFSKVHEPRLVFGQKYTVLGVSPSIYMPGHEVYEIEEFGGDYFWAGYFSPTSNRSEVAIAEARIAADAAELDMEWGRITKDLDHA